jgi:hypothetical protein
MPGFAPGPRRRRGGYLEPGHQGSVIGTEEAVLIEVDFEGETAKRFGLPAVHKHE